MESGDKALVIVVGMMLIFVLTVIILINLIPGNLHCGSYEMFNDGQSIQFRDCYYGKTKLGELDILVDIGE